MKVEEVVEIADIGGYEGRSRAAPSTKYQVQNLENTRN
jgi:hypothetical protein